ncbi:MAG: lysine transporter LysE [Deltaproteobacteria bacterium]|nr:MAG: lysine transporter LysE [Deltaproteobacteria bacterium]
MQPVDSLPLVWFSSFILAFSGAMMPGPMLAVTIRESARRGFIAGPLVVAGHAFLELALVTGLYLGLAALFEERIFLGFIGVIGGAALLKMAWGMFHELPSLTLDFSAKVGKGANPFVSGIVTSVTNPYFTLWWATAGLSAITLTSRGGIAAPGVFYAGHITGDLVWYSVISGLVHFGRKFLTDRRYRILVGLMATLLVIFSLLFIVNGVSQFVTNQ